MRHPQWCSAVIAWVAVNAILASAQADDVSHDSNQLAPASVVNFIQQHCVDCHSAESPEAGLNLLSLAKQSMAGTNFELWAKVHDRVVAHEMPPKSELVDEQIGPFARGLFDRLVELDRRELATSGRSVWRRMNRYEYENSLRQLLAAPWLQLKTMLPEDGELQRFNKIGEALDTSHVNLARYMQAADYALREVIAKSPTPPEKSIRRFYAREQRSFTGKVRYTEFNRSPERATFPLIDYEADLEVLNDKDTPFTVGESDPEKREREAFGVVASSYEPIEPRFSNFKAPESGRYKLRIKGYTFWAAGEDKKWWRPDREKISRGRRSEPIAIYSVSTPRQLRKLGEFDFQIKPTVQELEVYLLAGESIQPDAVRLFRSRPSNWHNPLAEKDGMPGVAFSYLEVEGPIVDQWPTPGHQLLFDPWMPSQNGEQIEVKSTEYLNEAKRLLSNFLQAAYHRNVGASEVDRFLGVVSAAIEARLSFQEALMAGYTAILCSPEFLCLEEHVGPLDDFAIATRLSLFLWNSLPDAELRILAADGKLHAQSSSDKTHLKQQINRLLDDDRSTQFVDAFLAYWLDLRKINDTSPDEQLYPDYYLDDSLVDSALGETQMFFRELIRENLPARNIIDSDFAFLNERLANHYQLPAFEGVALRRVNLPTDTPRGGMLTQASVLKVTANGTTTSPVVRGVWVNERILGLKTPPPPKSVPAIEPDTRGATTIRQQLELHRADTSCNRCHAIIDPVGFALENFDVAGGWRDHYRSVGDEGKPIEGFGKNGQPFAFRQGPPVDASGNLANGKKFASIYELKKLLVEDQRTIAKNLLQQLVVYATGAPMRFSDRIEVDRILDRLAKDDFRVKSMITEIVTSDLFLYK